MIKNSSGKVMIVEQDPTMINDGEWDPPLYDATNSDGPAGLGDLLSISHDNRGAIFPEQFDNSHRIPNWERRGNVAFCDGHAEFVSRRVAHHRRSVLPMKQ